MTQRNKNLTRVGQNCQPYPQGGREHDRKTCCSIYLHSHWREREGERGIERRKGGRLSERQNVVVLSAFLRRRRRKRGDSLDPAQDNLQMHFDFLSLNLGAIALIASESRKTD